MTDEQLQLLAAAAVEAAGSRQFIGAPRNLLAAINDRWGMTFGTNDFAAALDILSRIGGTQISSTTDMMRLDPPIILRAMRTVAPGRGFNARKVYPLIHEYAQFGGEWLSTVWDSFFHHQPIEFPPETPPSLSEPDQVVSDSSVWTGINVVAVTADNKDVVRKKIDEAMALLDQHQLSNVQKQQAMILLNAARDLVEAPDPPSSIIWDLIARAADVTGLVGFFLALFAVFAA
jgi:hypothetical protein